MKKTWLVGLALVSLAAAAPARADEWSKKYSVSGKADVRIATNDGNVEILSSDQKEVEARVITSGWQIPKDVRVTESQTGDHITVEARVPRGNWNWFGSSHRSLRIEVRVPREADLDVHSGDGNVTVQPVSGHIRVDTSDGNIDVDGLKGDVRLHSGDGHIEGRGMEGTLDVDTGDGHINVRGRFDLLNLRTGDGNIDAEVGNGSKMASAWSFRSGDGTISLRLPDGFHADLDAHTGDGHISLDFPVTISGSMSESTVRGKMNGGGQQLMIRSGDGSIRLEKL